MIPVPVPASTVQFDASVGGPNDAALRAAGWQPTPAPPPPVVDWSHYPFPPSSPWNAPIKAGATFGPAVPNWSSASPVVNEAQWSIPVVYATTTDPQVTLNGRQYRVPAGFTGSPDADHNGVVLQPDGVTAVEAWGWGQSNQYTQVYDCSTDSGWAWGASGSGARLLGGLVRTVEAQGPIRHALALALPASLMAVGWVPPAKLQDGDTSGYTGTVHMGTRFGLPTVPSGLAGVGLNLAVALHTYGAYVRDTSGSASLYLEQGTNSVTAAAWSAAWWQLYPLLRPVA